MRHTAHDTHAARTLHAAHLEGSQIQASSLSSSSILEEQTHHTAD